MINDSIVKIARYLTTPGSPLDQSEYEKQLNFIYGAIYECGLSSPAMFDEIVAIEQENSRMNSRSSCITTPESLVMEYSRIAFLLARYRRHMPGTR